MSEMKKRNSWTTVLPLAAAVCLCSTAARADMLTPSGSPSLSQLGFVVGSESVVYMLTAPTAGTFRVSLSDLTWPDQLGSMSFSATTATSVLGTLGGAGVTSFDVGSAGNYYAHVTAVAQGALDVGLYGLQVNFTPLVSAVPLPAAALLLLSGIAGIGFLYRLRPADSAAAAPVPNAG